MIIAGVIMITEDTSSDGSDIRNSSKEEVC